MNRKLNVKLLDQIQDAFNKHDVNEILSHFAEDCVWIMARGSNAPEGRKCIGKTEIGDVLRSRYEVIPDMRWEEIKHWVFNETKAISEWVVRGSPVNQMPFGYLGCDLWEFQDGFVTKKDTYWKSIE